MDRFLDENESAASSRASSPHHFTSRSRPPLTNGITSTQSSTSIPTPQTTATTQHSTAVQQMITTPSTIQHATAVHPTTALSTTMPHSMTAAVPPLHSAMSVSNDAASGICMPSSAVPLEQAHNTPENKAPQQYVPMSVIVASQEKAEPPEKRLKIESTSKPKLIHSKVPPLKPIIMGVTTPFTTANLLRAGLDRPVPLSSSSTSSHEHLFGSHHLPKAASQESSLYTQNN